MTDICREFGISRKTGYKVLTRYRGEGNAALTGRRRERPPDMNSLRRHPGSMILTWNSSAQPFRSRSICSARCSTSAPSAWEARGWSILRRVSRASARCMTACHRLQPVVQRCHLLRIACGLARAEPLQQLGELGRIPWPERLRALGLLAGPLTHIHPLRVADADRHLPAIQRFHQHGGQAAPAKFLRDRQFLRDDATGPHRVTRQEPHRPCAGPQPVHQRPPPVRLLVDLFAVDPAGVAILLQVALDPPHELLVVVVPVGEEELHRRPGLNGRIVTGPGEGGKRLPHPRADRSADALAGWRPPGGQRGVAARRSRRPPQRRRRAPPTCPANRSRLTQPYGM